MSKSRSAAVMSMSRRISVSGMFIHTRCGVWGERGKGTWKGARRQKAEQTHLIFPLCMEQLSPSVQTHRRIGLECQCPIVELERIVWVFEAFVDLV